MFNFLQGGKEDKGRFFKNLFKQGGKKMERKTAFAVLLLLGTLVLTGWGCRQERVSPTAPEMKTYRNEEFGFEFQYPSGWDLKVVKGDAFVWNGVSYELIDLQLREIDGEDYIGAYALAIAADPSHLTVRDWLMNNNRIGEAFELRDVAVNESLSGVEIQSSTSEVKSPNERAFPGTLAFADPEKNHVFLPELGQEHEIFSDYGITAEDFENQILKTLTWR